MLYVFRTGIMKNKSDFMQLLVQLGHDNRSRLRCVAKSIYTIIVAERLPIHFELRSNQCEIGMLT